MMPLKRMLADFQNARLPTALALPLQMQDFGTSRWQLCD
jgi:hypothetical protein